MVKCQKPSPDSGDSHVLNLLEYGKLLLLPRIIATSIGVCENSMQRTMESVSLDVIYAYNTR